MKKKNKKRKNKKKGVSTSLLNNINTTRNEKRNGNNELQIYPYIKKIITKGGDIKRFL
jgi:hypothetical protein